MTAARAIRPPKSGPQANGNRTRRLYRITPDQYHRMIESGSLTTRDRCQLIHGLLGE